MTGGKILYLKKENVTIPASGTVDIPITVPSGYWALGALARINVTGATYSLPYQNSAGFGTWIQSVTSGQIRITNTATVWNNCTIYLAIILVKD